MPTPDPTHFNAPSPYYEDDSVTIYHGDCRWVLPELNYDKAVVVTDPPYGISFESGWTGSSIEGDSDLSARNWALEFLSDLPALVFGSPSLPEPRRTVARLVWHRPGSGMGDLSLPWKPDWEVIYVIGSGFSAASRGSSVLSVPWDVFRGDALHPHQKPLPLMRDLIGKCPLGIVIDPFMGSGSTLRAAKDLGRRAIGVEVNERYCEIAAKRMGQEVLDLGGVA